MKLTNAKYLLFTLSLTAYAMEQEGQIHTAIKAIITRDPSFQTTRKFNPSFYELEELTKLVALTEQMVKALNSGPASDEKSKKIKLYAIAITASKKELARRQVGTALSTTDESPTAQSSEKRVSTSSTDPNGVSSPAPKPDGAVIPVPSVSPTATSSSYYYRGGLLNPANWFAHAPASSADSK